MADDAEDLLRMHVDVMEGKVRELQVLADAAREALRWFQDNTPDEFDLTGGDQSITIHDDPRRVKSLLHQALAQFDESVPGPR